MKSAYLLLVASAAFVICEAETSNDDVIWYPVDNEDGVFISLYGERRRTSTDSKLRNNRRARYNEMDQYPSYIPPTESDDPSFFHNIHDRRQFRRPSGFQQYPPAHFHNFRPFSNNPKNEKIINFDDDREWQRPDNQGFDENTFQEQVNDLFNFNKKPSEFPKQRPLAENRPSSEVFTTTTRRPAQRPTTNEWFLNPSQRPGIVRPNRPNSELVVFPEETTGATPTTTTAATPTELVPTETTTLTSCERRCPVTQEFNPVCGSDAFTYSNFSRLRCAQYCGKEVTLAFFGSCRRGRTARPPRQEATLLRVIGL